MRWPVFLTLLAGVLAGCAGPPEPPRWIASGATLDIAASECQDRANFDMRNRGWPARPPAGTPQADYRRVFFDECMKRRGYEAG